MDKRFFFKWRHIQGRGGDPNSFLCPHYFDKFFEKGPHAFHLVLIIHWWPIFILAWKPKLSKSYYAFKISWRWSHEEEDARRVMFAVIVLWIITPTLALRVARWPLGAFGGKICEGFFFVSSMVKLSMCNFTHLDSWVWMQTHLLYISFLTFWVLGLVLFHSQGVYVMSNADPLRKLQPLALSRWTYGFNVPERLPVIFLENISRML